MYLCSTKNVLFSNCFCFTVISSDLSPDGWLLRKVLFCLCSKRVYSMYHNWLTHRMLIEATYIKWWQTMYLCCTVHFYVYVLLLPTFGEISATPLLLYMLTLSILDDVKILKVTNLLLFFSLWYTSQYFNFLFLSKVCKFKAWFFVANGVSRRHLFYIYPVLNNPPPSFGTKT